MLSQIKSCKRKIIPSINIYAHIINEPKYTRTFPGKASPLTIMGTMYKITQIAVLGTIVYACLRQFLHHFSVDLAGLWSEDRPMDGL